MTLEFVAKAAIVNTDVSGAKKWDKFPEIRFGAKGEEEGSNEGTVIRGDRDIVGSLDAVTEGKEPVLGREAVMGKVVSGHVAYVSPVGFCETVLGLAATRCSGHESVRLKDVVDMLADNFEIPVCNNLVRIKSNFSNKFFDSLTD